MACYRPLQAFRTEFGEIVFNDHGVAADSIELPCGACVGCRLERARQWTVRVMHEAQCHAENCFITLTYDDEHLAEPGLVYADFQGFMKRLRSRVSPRQVRFFMCGEYGDQLGRPHFHAALFGEGFRADRYVWRDFGSGRVSYRSPLLESVWPFGLSSIGELTRESAAYVARYVLKKVSGSGAEVHYEHVDRETGEIRDRSPEFVRMSLRPGIGAEWFARYGMSDFVPHDRVVFDGRIGRAPRFYDEQLRKLDPVLLDELKAARVVKARERASDNTPERLAVRERVAAARLAFYKRKLK